jgi:hypothetical protein
VGSVEFKVQVPVTAAERGVLQYMRHARTVWWVCLEADGKDIVRIISGNMQVVGASLVMLQVQRGELELRHLFDSLQREAMELFAGFRIAANCCQGGVTPIQRCCGGGSKERDCSSKGPYHRCPGAKHRTVVAIDDEGCEDGKLPKMHATDEAKLMLVWRIL